MKSTIESSTKQYPSPKINKDQLVTVGDLSDLKLQLLFEIKQLIKELAGKPTKQWLKSNEVRKMLGVSAGTLQTLRNNGTIPFTKIGGIVFYDVTEIKQVLERKA